MSYFTIQSVTLSKNIFAPGETVTATIKLTALQATKSIKFGLTTVVANASNTNVDTLCAPYVTVTKSIAANASATVKATFTAYNAGASAPSGKTNTFTALGTYGRRASGTVYLIINGLVEGGSFDSGHSSTTYFVRSSVSGAHAIGIRCRPAIAAFSLERANLSGNPDDEGTKALLSLHTTVGDDTWASAMSCSISFGGNSVAVPVNTALAGITDDTTLLSDYTFNAGSSYTLRLTFGDAYESAVADASISEAFANVHLAGCGAGVAFGKFSASTEGNPLFECEYPAQLNNGAAITGAGSVSGAMTVGGALTVGGQAKFNGNVIAKANTLLKVVTLSTTITVAAGTSYTSTTIAASTVSSAVGSGYTAIGIVGWNSGTRLWNIPKCYLSSGAVEITLQRYNNGDMSTKTTVDITLRLLCLHTS